MSAEVNDLMREYFGLVGQKGNIKYERSIYMSDEENYCCNVVKAVDTYDTGGDCIDQMRFGNAVELCEYCAKRHEWYLELKRISIRRSAIMRRVKRIVTKEAL